MRECCASMGRLGRRMGSHGGGAHWWGVGNCGGVHVGGRVGWEGGKPRGWCISAGGWEATGGNAHWWEGWAGGWESVGRMHISLGEAMGNGARQQEDRVEGSHEGGTHQQEGWAGGLESEGVVCVSRGLARISGSVEQAGGKLWVMMHIGGGWVAAAGWRTLVGGSGRGKPQGGMCRPDGPAGEGEGGGKLPWVHAVGGCG